MSVALLGAIKAVIEPRTAIDTKGYLSGAIKLTDWFTTPNFLSDPFPTHPMLPSYLVSNMLVRGLKNTFGDKWLDVFCWLNIILFGLIALLLFHTLKSVARESRSLVLGAFAIVYLIFGMVDVPMWVFYALPEILFLFWVAVFLYCIHEGIYTGRHRHWIYALLVAVVAMFIRPTGVVLPIVWLCSLIVWGAGLMSRARRATFFTVILTTAVAAFLGVPWFVDARLSGDMTALEVLPGIIAQKLEQSVYYFKHGWVVADRESTYVVEPAGYWDFVRIAVLRFVYFLVPFRQEYSAIHTALNIPYMIVFVVAGVSGWRAKGMWSSSRAAWVLCLVLCSWFFALLHAVTLVSYDWRYQLPAMYPMWVLGGLGILAWKSSVHEETDQSNGARLSARAQ